MTTNKLSGISFDMNNFIQVNELSLRKSRNKIALMVLIFMIFLWSGLLNPYKSNLTTCYFKQLSGLDCPTCGLSRSFFAMSHFEPTASFHYHILGPFIYSIFLGFFVKYTLEVVARKEMVIRNSAALKKPILFIFFVVWTACWLKIFI